MPDGEFIPPVQYLPWWGLIGFVLLVAVVGWYVYLFMSTRKSRVPVAAAPQPTFAAAPEMIRARYLDLIGETRTAHAAGQLSVREAHHQLSLLLRSYVAEREGIQTVQMTLKDLRKTELTPLSDAVARLYPGAFSADYNGTVGQAADEAQRLVSSWR